MGDCASDKEGIFIIHHYSEPLNIRLASFQCQSSLASIPFTSSSPGLTSLETRSSPRPSGSQPLSSTSFTTTSVLTPSRGVSCTTRGFITPLSMYSRLWSYPFTEVTQKQKQVIGRHSGCDSDTTYTTTTYLMFVTWLPLSYIYTQYLVNSAEGATFFKDVNLKLRSNVGTSLERTWSNRKCEIGELQRRSEVLHHWHHICHLLFTIWQRKNPRITPLFGTLLSPLQSPPSTLWWSISALKKSCKHFNKSVRHWLPSERDMELREDPRTPDSSKKACKWINYNFVF